MIPSKVQNGSPVTSPKEIEISKLPDKKIQNNHLRESQWATREHRQLSKIQETMHEENKKFNRDNNQKMNQTQILEWITQ